MNDILRIISEIKSADNIAIMSHVFPDGDAVGSALALYLALTTAGKTVDVYLNDGVPAVYSFMPKAESVLTVGKNKSYDVAISLDVGDIDRIGEKVLPIFLSAKLKINIDHHETNSNFGDINYIEKHACSAGEIIYRLIKMYGLDIDNQIAQCLYIALATDTGGFRFSNTTGIALQVASDLVNCGIDVSDISRRVFDVVSEKKVRLIGIAGNSLEIINEKIALMSIGNEDLARLKAGSEDLDGIVNFARNIAGIEVAVFLVELQPGSIKANLRSNTFVDVAKIAENFSGGGHKRAAGCRFDNSTIAEAKRKLVEQIMLALDLD